MTPARFFSFPEDSFSIFSLHLWSDFSISKAFLDWVFMQL